MGREPQRTIKEAFIEDFNGENPRGLTAAELLDMPKDIWGNLRDNITECHVYEKRGHTPKRGCIAYCRKCGDRVYIRAARNRGINLPFFEHYRGSNPKCPWYRGRKPRDSRAAQYQGRQESPLHRSMCAQIARLVKLDKRYIRHTIDKAPPKNSHKRIRRRPDIYAEWEDFGPFAIEFQLSNTFQEEISGRGVDYKDEKIPLLWILGRFDPKRKVLQNFCDVLRPHRNNAFVLDDDAIDESQKQRTLVLTCYLHNKAGGFDPPKLVRFDKLHFPKFGLPYYEDRSTKRHLEEIKERRCSWFEALKEWKKEGEESPQERAPLKDPKSQQDIEYPQSLFFAMAFSIVELANGKNNDPKYNFVSKHKNIVNMLTTYLDGHPKLAPYADLLTELIEKTAAKGQLRNKKGQDKVSEHLGRCRDAAPEQKDEESDEWKLLKELFPEALNPISAIS